METLQHPSNKLVYGEDFVKRAEQLGYDRRQAMLAWRSLMQAARNQKLTPNEAYPLHMSRGDLAELLRTGQGDGTRWELTDRVGRLLLRTVTRMELRRFVARHKSEPEVAAGIAWGAFLRRMKPQGITTDGEVELSVLEEFCHLMEDSSERPKNYGSEFNRLMQMWLKDIYDS